MAASMAQTPPESYWNQHSKTLRRVQDEKARQANTRQAFQPLSDEHPLLQGTKDTQSSPRTHRASPHRVTNGVTTTPPLPRGRHSRTPPSRLPRMQTPPDHRHESRVRGARFGVLPHVRNQANGYQNGYDSWGEEPDSDSDEDYNGFPANPRGFPYPVVMYPMVMPQSQRRKTKDKGKKKRVRYKGTPVLLNSRENTLHEPLAIHDTYSTFAYEDEDRLRYNPYDEGGGASGGGFTNSPRFSYISTGGHKYDPFDPRMNPVLARYQMGGETRPVPVDTSPHVRRRPQRIGSRAESLSALKYLDTNPLFSKILTESLVQNYLLEDILPDVLNEVVIEGLDTDNSLPPVPRDRTSHYEPETSFPIQTNSLEKFLNDILDEVVSEGATEVVHDSMLQMVDSHLERAAVYDIAVDIMNETIEMEAPELISDMLADMFLEELLEEEVIEPEIEDITRDIVTDVCTNYNDKRRRQDLKLVKRDTGERLLEGLALDYLLSMSARQGKIWTEGEHANKLFDSMILNILLAQQMDVAKKRHSNVMSKPVRRHHEKIVTDVATDVVLEELCKTLDEDMADLDEYEMGMENTDRRQKFSPLEKWIRGS